ARESRIYVEGRHDAELVERVWGDDLRIEGVVVEYLGGIDDLPSIVKDFRPGPPWKEGVCAALGWPVDPPGAWRTILGAVSSFADLEPSLLGRVEELIDFVTSSDGQP
ncbi:MAG: DUF3097 family protein, partial [Kineosporiaceae bacterium]